jgi:hypothetical protein
MPRLSDERGSALVEAAILFPCLVLVLFWSIALTDVLVLKLKTSEAARFALWETTAWKSPARIQQEVQQRFDDLRSPSAIRNPWTGLLAFPRSAAIRLHAAVDTTSSEVTLAGSRIGLGPAPGIVRGFVERASGWMASAVQSAMRAERFNTHGAATVRVRLRASRAGSKVLSGGDLLGHRGGGDLGAPRSLADLALEAPLATERPMRIVFDTWKAWPKPSPYELAGGPTDHAVSPRQTYPQVEKQVAAQVGRIAFFGMRQLPWFGALDSLAGRILGTGIGGALLGGHPPSIFSSARMDSPERGPITIRPMQPPQARFVPDSCDAPGGGQQPCTSGGQGIMRVGDVESNAAATLGGLSAYTEHEDVTRHTVPFRVNSRYWRWTGGTFEGFGAVFAPPPPPFARDNGYVRAWECRGSFFAGSVAAQEADVTRRYHPPC